MIEKQLPYKVKVYETLKNDIITGKYKAGEVLNERKLSDLLGISRTPIREALQMLEKDGWVETEAFKGTTVRKFDIAYLRDIMRIREALEQCAIVDAIHNATADDIDYLEKLYTEQEKILKDNRPEQFIRLDRKFHNYIYQLSGNKELVRLLTNYYDIFLFSGILAVTGSDERSKHVMEEHRRVLDAFHSGDPEVGIKAMQEHMNRTRDAIYNNMKKNQ